VNGVPDAIGRRRISSLLLLIASVIALITAADAPIAPASPQPLTPSGLPGHSVVVWLKLERRQVVGARHGVVHERRRHRLAVAVIDRGF